MKNTPPRKQTKRVAVVQIAIAKKVSPSGREQAKRPSAREQRIARQIGQLAPSISEQQAKKIAQKVAELNEITSALLNLGAIDKTLAKAKMPPLD